MCGAVVVVSADHHREDVDNFDLVLDAARSSATTSLSAASQPGPSGLSGGTANGTTDEGAAAAAASPQEETNGALGQCVATQNCQADQSATSLSPPVVSMATTHYAALDEDDLPGECSTNIGKCLLISDF